MMPGRLIAVVGPSGVGKDSVMTEVAKTMPNIHLLRRVITRPPQLGGEDYEAVSVAEFEARAKSGAFAVHWQAHGLRYGIPTVVNTQLNEGKDCLVNFSRKALADAALIFPRFLVLNITADPDTLAKRLSARARETPDQIAKRLGEAQKSLPANLDVIHVSNNDTLELTVAQVIGLLQPVRP